MPKLNVILVGGDKGGVGKTTVARTLIDYFGTNQTRPGPSIPICRAARSNVSIPT